MSIAVFILSRQQHGFLFKIGVREAPVKYRPRPIKWFSFSESDALKEWEEKIFRGKVIYNIEKNQSLSYVRAASDNAASALYYKIKIDAKNNDPVISWKWRVEKFPVKRLPENLETQDEDDFAARVYVIFPAKFILNSKVLEYIWAESLPAGKSGTSPSSKNIKLIVLRSGYYKDKGWAKEEREIVKDYVKMFGHPPGSNIGAVAFMTNTEHTGTDARAMYDDIDLSYGRVNVA